jgi:mannose-1-phosphate guanylyltransferase
MKAVVLVGGEGTRLRPLTHTIPKPLLPLVERPFLHQVLDHLATYGVHEVILSSPYLETTFQPFLEERHGDPAITWITEKHPLGTAGAVVNALDHVEGAFLVLNGDVLTDLDLRAMLAFHHQRKAMATISLTPVEDARPYGLVDTDDEGRVLSFREKPTKLVPGNINAGTYVLEPEALAGWSRGLTISIEREVFPNLIEARQPVYGFLSDAYWMDLGTPERYLQAHFDILEGRVGGERFSAPYVSPSARVHPEARLGRMVVVAQDAVVETGADVDRSLLQAGAVVGENARVTDSILGPGSRVGAGARVGGSVLAAGAGIRDGSTADGARVMPGELAGTS